MQVNVHQQKALKKWLLVKVVQLAKNNVYHKHMSIEIEKDANKHKIKVKHKRRTKNK
jgi:hypothetical protein